MQAVGFVCWENGCSPSRLEPYQASRKDEYTAVPTLGEKKYGFILGNSAIGECGYVNYADTGFHNSFRDVTFYSPDYIFILSTGKASIDVEGDSFCYSNRIGVLFHKNSGGTVSLRGGKWHARDTLFQVKSYSEPIHPAASATASAMEQRSKWAKTVCSTS